MDPFGLEEEEDFILRTSDEKKVNDWRVKESKRMKEKQPQFLHRVRGDILSHLQKEEEKYMARVLRKYKDEPENIPLYILIKKYKFLSLVPW